MAKVQLFKSEIFPRVNILIGAYLKMQAYVERGDQEVGWLSTAIKEDNLLYTITDCYLFDQQVSAAETEITTEGLQKFAEELSQLEGGMTIWNEIKAWGHSHVNMGTTPSGQDDSQMEFFENSGHEWFIRIIMNKKGSINITLYDYANNLIYTNLDFHIVYDDLELTPVQLEINKLLDRLDELETSKEELMKSKLAETVKSIEVEFKKKVKSKIYATPTYGGYAGYAGYKGYAGYTNQGAYSKSGYFDKKNAKKIDDEEYSLNLLQGAKDVYYYFNVDELEAIGALDKEEAAEEIQCYLTGDIFTKEDIDTIYKEAVEIYTLKGIDYGGQYSYSN